MNNYVTSDCGKKFIKECEGLRLSPYKDVAGNWTVGYGHLMNREEIAEMKNVSESDADALFDSEIKTPEKAVQDLVKIPISQNEFDALVSFTYNLGRIRLQNSTLLRVLNSGDVESAAEHFLEWNKAGGKVDSGLVKRRSEERRMFLEGCV